MACNNNRIQNDRAAWVPTQCNPVFFANSVCRCCCSNDDGCNFEDEFCFEEPTCPPIPKRPNLIVDCSDGRKIDSECSAECKDENYDLIGSNQVSCKFEKFGPAWTPNFPRCQAKCPLETPPAPAVQSCSKGNKLGSRCDITCPAGFRRVGAPTRTCSGNPPRWNSAFASCEAVCDKLDGMDNGSIKCTDGINLGSKCSYTCEDGYELTGSNIKTCSILPNGKASWVNNGREPRCEALCDELNPITNGRLDCTGRSLGDTCTHICDTDRFSLLGPKERTCTNDLMHSRGVDWDKEEAFCQPQCPELRKTINTVVACTSGVDLGSVCTFYCTGKFEMIGKESTTCMLDGKLHEKK